MSIYVRADFDFKDEKNGIKHCTGYVVCKDVVMTDYGCDFKVHSVVIKKLIANKPDFEKLEQLAIQNCKVLREEYSGGEKWEKIYLKSFVMENCQKIYRNK